MGKYRKATIEGHGEIAFYGNTGAVSEFEDKTGKAIGEVFSDQNNVRLNDILSLMYECHLIACIRLNVDPIDFKKMKAFSEVVMPLYPDVVNDILEDIAPKDQKKTMKAVK